MNDQTAIERESKLSFAKVIVCVILILSAVALAMELVPSDVQVGITASAATQSQLKSKQAQLESQQKNISAKLKSLKKSKAAAQDQLDLVNELVENLQTQITTVNNQINAANAEIKEIEEEIAAKDREIATAAGRNTAKKAGSKLTVKRCCRCWVFPSFRRDALRYGLRFCPSSRWYI